MYIYIYVQTHLCSPFSSALDASHARSKDDGHQPVSFAPKYATQRPRRVRENKAEEKQVGRCQLIAGLVFSGSVSGILVKSVSKILGVRAGAPFGTSCSSVRTREKKSR